MFICVFALQTEIQLLVVEGGFECAPKYGPNQKISVCDSLSACCIEIVAQTIDSCYGVYVSSINCASVVWY
jgi:hypothetical protein